MKGELGEVPEAEGMTYTLPSQQLRYNHVAVDIGDRHKAWSKLGLPRSHGASGYESNIGPEKFLWAKGK